MLWWRLFKLRRRLGVGSPQERLQAVEDLVDIGGERVVGPLLRALKGPDPKVRLKVLEKLPALYGNIVIGWFDRAWSNCRIEDELPSSLPHRMIDRLRAIPLAIMWVALNDKESEVRSYAGILLGERRTLFKEVMWDELANFHGLWEPDQ